MRKEILLLVLVVLFSSCHKSKSDIVTGFIKVLNSHNEEEISGLLTDNFTYYWNDTETLSKNDFLTYVNSKKAIEAKSIILNLQYIDSIVKTEEKLISIIDSLLEVTPNLVRKKTYKFSGDKLKSITNDTTLYYEEYTKSFNEKTTPFFFYLKDKYDIQYEKDLLKDIKKYLSEYITLSASDRKTYRTYACLQGTFVSDDNPFYRKLVFKGKRTVSIVDALFGMSFATSYEVDENYIRIRTDQSDLLFEVVDGNTLVGEGFAKGTFKKAN